MDANKYPKRWLRHLVSMPFIWMPFVALIFADVLVEIYHRVCFPLYGLQCLRRKDYIRLDRQKLSYLTWSEKMGCMYCGYANGWVNYARVIAGMTEQYWCGIKHQKYEGFHEPAHHAAFVEYGDEAGFRERYCPPKS